MVDLNIPRLPVEWFVVIDNELSGFLVLRDQFSFGFDVVQRRNCAVSDLNHKLRVTQLECAGTCLCNGGSSCRIGGCERTNGHRAQRFAVSQSVLV